MSHAHGNIPNMRREIPWRPCLGCSTEVHALVGLVIQINVVLSEISEIELFIGDCPTACFELCVEDLGVYLLLIGDVSLGVKVVVVEDM